MTDPNTLNLKLIQTLLESIDLEDPKDAALAVKTIKGLLVTEWKDAK